MVDTVDPNPRGNSEHGEINSRTVYRPLATQVVAFTAVAANAAAISAYCGNVRIRATEDCYISIVGTATSSSCPIGANETEYFGIGYGDVISVIRATADGNLAITELGM